MKNTLTLPILTFLMLLFVSSQSLATTYTFTALSGDWQVATNWSDNTVPPEPIASSDVVVIAVGHLVTIPVGYTINNNGLIMIATTDYITSEGKMAVHGVLNNNGRITTGRLEINGLYNHNAGATIEEGGIVYVRPGGVFNVVGNLVCLFGFGNLGTLNVLPSGVLDIRGTFNNIGTLVNDGIFKGPIGMWGNQVCFMKGSGIFTSNFTAVDNNVSTIQPGNSTTGCMTFSGDFNNSAPSHKLKIQINGPNACTDFGKLIVGGTAYIGGTLDVTFGYTPSSPQNFQIIEAAAIVGSFSTINISPGNIPATYSSGILSINAVLATDLVDFTTQVKAETVHLNWHTASEYQNKGFEIERSFDGSLWVSIGLLQGAGSSNAAHSYTFEDTKPRVGKNYYRLRQIGWAGESTFSTVKAVELPNVSPIMHISPNPATENITIQLPIGEEEQKVQVELFDILGRCLTTQVIDISNHTTSLKLDSSLKNGFYLIRLTRGREFWVSRLVVKK